MTMIGSRVQRGKLKKIIVMYSTTQYRKWKMCHQTPYLSIEKMNTASVASRNIFLTSHPLVTAYWWTTMIPIISNSRKSSTVFCNAGAGVGRGGETKYLNFHNWVVNGELNFWKMDWTESKNLTVLYTHWVFVMMQATGTDCVDTLGNYLCCCLFKEVSILVKIHHLTPHMYMYWTPSLKNFTHRWLIFVWEWTFLSRNNY